MDAILQHMKSVLPLVPTLVVVLLATVAVRLARRLTTGRPGASSRGEFRLQIAHLVIGLSAALLLLVVIPVEPGLRNQLLSLFGLLLSAAIALASTTFVGNVMAGVMLKAVRNFRTGDFVQVGDHFGRVTERSLLSTEIQTEHRDLVTLPNLHLVTNPVKVVRASGTIVSAEVSLGYDVHHERIEDCLLAAAEQAGLKDPFVLVMDLGDFSVLYRVCGLLEEVKQLLTVRSRLRVAMLDGLHAAQVEIVSPNFMNQRALSPETPVLPQPAPRPAATTQPEEATLEEIAFDKAEDAASLDQLVAEHEQTRTAIAALADPPGDMDKDQLEEQKVRLTRRLAYLEAAVSAKQQAVEANDEEDTRGGG